MAGRTTRTLILGAGFGGIATALALRRRLDARHEIVLVDRRDRFFMGLRKLWVMVGLAELEEGVRPLSALRERGIDVRRAEVTGIDAASRRAWLDGGAVDADYLVIALGAEPRPDLVPGLADHAFDLYDVDSVKELAHPIAAFNGGRIAIAIAGLPYKCPPAPYEAAFLLDHRFRDAGIRDRVTITFTTLQPRLLPNAGEEGAAAIAAEFERRGIEYHTDRELLRAEAGRFVFEDGEEPFDIGIAVPPHLPPAVVRESGLTEGGDWIPVDPGTLETRHPGVYAIGDVVHIPLAGGAALPKAGLFAEAHGRHVAAAIAAQVEGGPPAPPFGGHGHCYLELGGGEAALIEGAFYALPKPSVRIVGTGPEYARAKRAFETDRLREWFGR
ncbi:MAG: FAD-dependent oxidoreductase [bacterium]|jgi:sulfide:quinone oxidoreductase|nr:MAG: NAD(P)/FAD-dependent oxidoreductase [bacterium]